MRRVPARCTGQGAHRSLITLNEEDAQKDLASIANSAYMCPHLHGHHLMQEEHAAPTADRDEGHRQLERMIEALTATRSLIEQQIARYAEATSPSERGDILHAAIIGVEDRLSPRCRLDDLAKIRDAQHTIAGRRGI